MHKKIIIFAITLLTLLLFPIQVYAHSGRTDSNGGHYDHSTGEYHYHHGYPAHDHWDMDNDGDIDCPYKFDDKTGHNSGGSSGGSASKPKPNPSKEDDPLGPGDLIERLFPYLIIPIFALLVLAMITSIFSEKIAELCISIVGILVFLDMAIFGIIVLYSIILSIISWFK